MTQETLDDFDANAFLLELRPKRPLKIKIAREFETSGRSSVLKHAGTVFPLDTAGRRYGVDDIDDILASFFTVAP